MILAAWRIATKLITRPGLERSPTRSSLRHKRAAFSVRTQKAPALHGRRDEIGEPELATQQLDKAGALPRGEPGDRLGRADAGDGEEVGGLDRADLRHRDEQVEHLGAGEIVGTGGEDRKLSAAPSVTSDACSEYMFSRA